MMDFNSSASVSGQITALIDIGMQRVREQLLAGTFVAGPVADVHAVTMRETAGVAHRRGHRHRVS